MPKNLGLFRTNKNININHFKINDNEATVLAEGIKSESYKTLNKLFLSDNRLTENGAASLIKAIPNDALEIDLSSN